MKNIFFVSLLAFLFVACASSGRFVRAEHNGKVYWLPPECKDYQVVANSDKIMCFGTGEIEPASPAEYEAYLKERELREAPYYHDNFFILVEPRFYGHYRYDRRRHFRHHRPHFRPHPRFHRFNGGFRRHGRGIR